MADYELGEIHRSENLGAYYRALDEEFQKIGYKFADLPFEKPESTESGDEKAAD